MVYNDTTDLLGIIQQEEDYCELGNSGISGNATLLKQFTRYNNITMSKIWAWIFQSAGDWKYDDSNQTNLPQATQSIASGTYKYALPTDALVVTGVEILLETGGSWTKLIPMTENEWKENYPQGEYGKDSGKPTYYMLKGDTIILDVIPDFSTTNGLKVYFERGSVAFASTDTSTAPGFASEFHNAVSVGGSLEYLKVHKPNSAVMVMLQGDWANYERSIKDFYTMRFKDSKPAIITSHITEYR